MPTRRYGYQIDIQVNKKQLQNLKKQLRELADMNPQQFLKITGKNTYTAKLSRDLNDVQMAARQAEEALTRAYSVKLNTTNIATFKNELSQAGYSIQRLQQDFSKAGAAGAVTFSNLQSQLAKTSIVVKEQHQLLNRIGTTLFNSFKWTLSTGLVNRAVGAVERAWGFAKDLDESLNNIRIVTGQSADEMQRFAKRANETALSLGKTTTDYTNAALIYYQQGLSEKEVEARTKVTLKTANVTGQSAQTVSEQLTAVWGGYKVNAEQAELYVDRLAAVAATTASDLEELSTGMSKVASAAASLGVGEDQLAAQLSTIISVTRQAPETVGTALRTVYARITDIQAGIEEDGTTLGMYSGKLADVGINVLDTSGKLRNMGQVIEQVGKKWSTFSREQQIYIAQTMAGQRQYSNLVALFDNFDQYESAMETAANATGTLNKQQEIYMTGTQAQLTNIRTTAEKLYSSLFNTKSMTPLLKVLETLTYLASTFVDTLGGGAGALQALLTFGTMSLQGQIGRSITTFITNRRVDKLNRENLNGQIATQEGILNNPESTQQQREQAERQLFILRNKRDNGNVISSQDFDVLTEANANLTKSTNDINILLEQRDSLAKQLRDTLTEQQKDSIVAWGQEKGVATHDSGKAWMDIWVQHPEESGIRSFINQFIQGSLQAEKTASEQTTKILQTLENYQQGNYSEDIAISKRIMKKRENNAKEIKNILEGDIDNFEKLFENKKVFSWLDKRTKEYKELYNQFSEKLSQRQQIQKDIDDMAKKADSNRKKQLIDIGGGISRLLNGESTSAIAADNAAFSNWYKSGQGKKWQWFFAEENTPEYQEYIKTVKQRYLKEGRNVSDQDIQNNIRQHKEAAKPDVLRQLSSIVDQYHKEIESIEQSEKKLPELKQKLKQTNQQIIAQYQKIYKDRATKVAAEIEKYNQEIDNAQAQQEKVTTVKESFNKLLTDTQGILDKNKYQEYSTFFESIKDLENLEPQHIDRIKTIIAQIGEVSKDSAKSAENLKENLENFNPDDISKAKEKHGNAQTQYLALREKMSGQVIGNTIASVGSGVTSTVMAGTQLSNMVSSLKNATNAGDALIRTFSSLGMIVLNAGRSFSIFNDIGAKAVEKITKAQIGGVFKNAAGGATLFGRALQHVSGNLGVYALGLSAAIGIVSIFVNYMKQQHQQYIQSQKDIIENANAALQEVENHKKLYDSLTELQKKYDEGNASRKEVKDQIVQLCKQYDLENEKIISLFENYSNLGKAISEARKANLQQEVFQNQRKMEAASNVLGAAQVYEDNGGAYYYKGEAFFDHHQGLPSSDKEVGEILQDLGFSMGTNKVNVNYSSYNYSYGFNEDTPQNRAKALQKIEQAIKTIEKVAKDTKDSQLLQSDLYKSLVAQYNYAIRDENKGNELLAAYQAQRAATIGLQWNGQNIENVSDYIKARQQIINNLGEEYTQDQIDKYLKTNESDLYLKYGVRLGALQKIFSQKDEQKQLQTTLEMLKDLDDQSFSRAVELDPKILKDTEKLKKALQIISNFKGFNLNSVDIAEMEEAAAVYEAVIEKAEKGQKISSKEFKELQTKAPDIADMFVQTFGGYTFGGRLSDLRNAVKEKYSDSWGIDYAQIINYLSGLQRIKDLSSFSKNSLQKAITDMQSLGILEEFGTQNQKTSYFSLALEKTSQALQILKNSPLYLEPENKSNIDQYIKISESNNALNGEQIKSILSLLQEINPSDIENIEETISQTKESALSTTKVLHDMLFPVDSDIKDSDLIQLIETLDDVVKETNSNLDEFSLEEFAKEILRFNSSLQNSSKEIEKWKQIIKNPDSLVSIAEIKNAYEDLLGLKADNLSNEFTKNDDNLERLRTILLGTKEEAQGAYEQLRKLALIDLINGAGGINEKAQNAQIDLANKLSTLEFGDTISQELVDSLFNALLENPEFTYDKIQSFFDLLGIQIRVFLSKQGDKFIPAWDKILGATVAADFSKKYGQITPETTDALKNAEKRINKQTQLTKLLDKEVDLYHDINIELNNIDRKLSRLQKIQKNLTGSQLLDNLRQQSAVLDEQNQKLHQKQSIQQQDLIRQSSILKGFGVTFNADGSIGNYGAVYGAAINNVQDIIQQIRAVEKSMYGLDTSSQNYIDQQDRLNELKREMNQRQQTMDNIEKYISKYDNARKDYFDIADKIEDAARAAIELNLQMFQTKVQIKLDLSEAERAWNTFVSEVLNRQDILNPNNFLTRQAAVQLAMENIPLFESDIGESLKEVARYEQEIRRFQQSKANGTNYVSELFNSESEAITAYETVLKRIEESAKSQADAIDSIKQAVLDAYQDVTELFAKNNQIYSFIDEQLKHNINLVDLIDGSQGGRTKDALYNRLGVNNTERISQAREQVRLWAQEYAKATDGAVRKIALTNWQEATKELNSITEEAIQNLKNKYKNMVSTVLQETESALTNGLGLEYYSILWDNMKEESESYLDEINAAFAIRNTSFLYQQAINQTTSLTSQQRIRAVMDQQLKILKEKDKLTQYDVDRAQKILDIEKARITLEQARNNKTSLRLKRDSQGNYSYQFTADQQAIGQAQNNLEKAQNDLYNFDLDALRDNQQEVINILKDYKSEIEGIYNDQNLSEQQRAERLAEARRHLQEQLTLILQQNVNIRSNLENSASQSFKKMIDNDSTNFDSFMEEITSNVQGFINTLINDPESVFNLIDKGLSLIEQAHKEMTENINTQLQLAEDGYLSFKENGIDPVVESSEKVLDNLDDLITKASNISSQVDNWTSAINNYASSFGALGEKIRNAGNNLLTFRKIFSNENNFAESGVLSDSLVGVGSTQIESNYIKGSKNNWFTSFMNKALGKQQVVKSFSPNSTTLTEENKNNWLTFLNKALENIKQQAAKSSSPKGASPLVRNQLSMAVLQDYVNNYIKGKSSSPNGASPLVMAMLHDYANNHIKGNSWFTPFSDKLSFVIGNLKKNGEINSQLYKLLIAAMGFDTGGYTGDWHSKEGKLAVLHEKELVLNKQDTENMLKILQLSRKMMSIAQSNIFDSIQQSFNQQFEKIQNRMFTKVLTTNTFSQRQQALQQVVNIEAVFPNVNSKEEIEEALTNLVNVAAQRAQRINKN